MKRIVQFAVALALIFLIPAGFTSAQEKKEEKHIKIIISENDGKEKVVIDTTFSGIANIDSLKLKDGKVIYVHEHDGPVMMMKHGDGEKVVIVKSGSHVSGGEAGDVMTWTAASSGEKGNVIYINEGHDGMKDGEVKYNIEVRTDESGNRVEKTNYVIAKDGMVVTIEGDNEEKVKELASAIETKLGVSKNDKSTKTEVVKEETKKKTTKK